MNSVTVISSIVKSGVRFVKFLRFGKKDVQQMRQIGPYGTDANPIEGTVAIYSPTTEKGKAVIIGCVNKNQKSEPGEHRIFSTDDDGVEQIALHLKNNGTAEFGGDSDFMVRFSEMESAFNELKADFNSLVVSYNSHIHITTATVGPTAVPGVIAPTPSSGSQSTADISGAKIEEIKTS